MLIVQFSDTQITAHGTRRYGVASRIGMQLVRDPPLEHDEVTFVAPAFLLHHRTEDNNLVTFHLDVNSSGSPYSFIEQS